MQVETKYNIGDHIMVIYESKGEVCLYDDYIREIVFKQEHDCTPMGNTMKTEVLYYGDTCPDEIKEEDIVKFEDDACIVQTIKKELRKHEKNNI